MMFLSFILSFVIILRLLVPALDHVWVYGVCLLVSIMCNLHVCSMLQLLPPHITYIVCETSCSISAFICQITPFICRFKMPIPEYTRLLTSVGFLVLYVWVNNRKRNEARIELASSKVWWILNLSKITNTFKI